MNPQLASAASNSNLMGSACPQHLKQADTPASRESTHITSQKMLAQLENSLSRHLPGQMSAAELNTTDFTPLAVSDRIIGFVEKAISQRAQSGLEAQSMLQQAKEGIARGFAEARDILDKMSQMTDSIKGEINKTEELIFKGLDELQNKPIETPQQQVQVGKLISQSASQSTQFKQSSQASIQIITQDGDKVEVSYSALIEAASHSNVSQSQQMISASAEFSSTTSSSFQFSVQGNLDSGEQLAINELLNNVGELANQFFNADVQAAFKSAMELGFNSNELKGFALNFQQSTYTEVTQTYQRTEQLNSPAADSLHGNTHQHSRGKNRGPAAAINMLSQLNDLMEQSRENTRIQQAEKTIKSLLIDMLELLQPKTHLPTASYIKETIEKM